MNENPLDKEQHLRSQLDEYHIEIPDFPMKASKWSRLIQFLASPGKDPLESFSATENGIIAMKVVPALGGAGIMLTQLFFFL